MLRVLVLLAIALLFALLLALVAPPAAAQTVASADVPLSWRTYSAQRQARVRVLPSTDDRRPIAVVVDDRSAGAAPVTDEAAFVADLIGREQGFDPTEAVFVFRFSPAAFADGAPDAGKTLLLRATFTRGASGNLTSPQWRVITPDGLEELTDRALR